MTNKGYFFDGYFKKDERAKMKHSYNPTIIKATLQYAITCKE
ncbi:MAG: hypothetical protein PHN38_04470 [Sulfurospirillaceae bacterium]|nr:hypothetical protein [Sulfurospirillaceae bacterium]